MKVSEKSISDLDGFTDICNSSVKLFCITGGCYTGAEETGLKYGEKQQKANDDFEKAGAYAYCIDGKVGTSY